MALYAIGDLHLSTEAEKPMDIFRGWENYTEKLIENWNKTVSQNDTVVICGDVSWAMKLESALSDLRLIDSLNGRRKFILKGNHDYWWTSVSKMHKFFSDNGLSTLEILHNNAYEAEGFKICGSRGWIFENGAPHDEKIINRERDRIEASLKAAEKLSGEPLLFLHYPPVFASQELAAYLDIMREYGINRCFYGHIHGAGHKSAVTGLYRGIRFAMVSADYLAFTPLRV